jgi:hypothetical protein
MLEERVILRNRDAQELGAQKRCECDGILDHPLELGLRDARVNAKDRDVRVPNLLGNASP